ncbi:hypothetical protein HDU97_001843 [Phlyctochytrium planicorne]|nr:hypothetical protein HDU97_001843 [Phlyctochytrium planicorne]
MSPPLPGEENGPLAPAETSPLHTLKSSPSSSSLSLSAPKSPVSAAWLAMGIIGYEMVKGMESLVAQEIPVASQPPSVPATVNEQKCSTNIRKSSSDATSTETEDAPKNLSSARTCQPPRSGRARLLHLPDEVLLQILSLLPTKSLVSMLNAQPKIAATCSTELKSRLYSIKTLDDFRLFIHFAEGVGPIFYRSGTIILFAQYFMRLIPEAQALLGVGYAAVLAWFMCLFYAVPFLGALVFYFAMDTLHFATQLPKYVILSLPPVFRVCILSKKHQLHPRYVTGGIPSQVIMRLRFEGPKPILATSDIIRCCGPAGSLATSQPIQQTVQSPDNLVAGSQAPEDVPRFVQLEPEAKGDAVSGKEDSIESLPGANQNWGLMSPYTPWHLYLLTYAISRHTRVSQNQKDSSSVLSTNLEIGKSKPKQYLVCKSLQHISTVLSLICTTISTHLVSKTGNDSSYLQSTHSDLINCCGNREGEDNISDAEATHRALLMATVYEGVTRLTLSRVSLAWWFRLHPVPSLRALMLERCEVDENGISIIAAACQGIVGLVIRKCEVRSGDGGWKAREAEPIVEAQQSQVDAEEENDIVESEDTNVFEILPPMNRRSSNFSVHDMKNLSGVGVFPRLRLARFELCGPTACGIEAIRMVLDRAPALERVEFVGMGPLEESFLESVGYVELEKVDAGALSDAAEAKASLLIEKPAADLPLHWFDSSKDAEVSIQQRIDRRGSRLLPRTSLPSFDAFVDAHAQNTDASTYTSPYPQVPVGYQKCHVVEGNLADFKSKWKAHLKERQNLLWEGQL